MLKKLSSYTFALLGLILLFNSCTKEYESIQSVDETKILEYLKANNLTDRFKKDASGYYYEITTQGASTSLKNTDSVFYRYDLKSLAGEVFSETAANGNEGTFVGYVTPVPYRDILTKLGRGGKFTVILPSYLAFGKNGSGSIGPNEIIMSNVSVYTQSTQAAIDKERIQAYLTSKGITNAIEGPGGVYYVVVAPTTPGTAEKPIEVINFGSSITAKYTGRLLDGTVFDSGTDGTFVFTLAGVIKGWGKVLPQFSTGAKLRLFIPSGLAYGTSGSTSQTTGATIIPANAILDFDIEITAVTN
ncbi:FKBP-type peptidyl-prolyl cis-trans isomerase [Pedobacter sp. MC2016-14]|uniref:FKBP-type peptidyl-prolyl cis-trans isomerase n=1 Tax=Pedobacter sp. MC2016-14 TaxID=2897327 RepID=UPI001E5FEAA7|nr:FKBP-type peptidyl-prolyl cis-trans isomerase [Pedobacter sp. MC2016-14]MCD0486727.1 FKBP-type peptidyl-prolyl cis-trans isomerase [Pedobacter sp. MC2016-14]